MKDYSDSSTKLREIRRSDPSVSRMFERSRAKRDRNAPEEGSPCAEVMRLGDCNDWELLMDDFVVPINDLCESALWIGDSEFFDSGSCAKIAGWLDARLERGCDAQRACIYEPLRAMCEKAVEHDTGITIAL